MIVMRKTASGVMADGKLTALRDDGDGVLFHPPSETAEPLASVEETDS